jgi:hypothetical protein
MTKETDNTTWCEDLRRQKHDLINWIEAQRDGTALRVNSLNSLNTEELRDELARWIRLGIDAVRDTGNLTNEKAASLTDEELKEEVAKWAVLTLDAVRGFPALAAEVRE